METESQEELSVYQEMTPKEAADVLKLMEEYEPLVNNSVAFAEQLSNDLYVLDEVRGPRAVTQPKRRCLSGISGHRQLFRSRWALGLRENHLGVVLLQLKRHGARQEDTAAPFWRVRVCPTVSSTGSQAPNVCLR